MSLHETISELVLLLPGFLLAITGHELAHGLVADRLGDPTARRLGRLTANPLAHLDPWGTLIFFVAKIGWAKPVPVTPSHFARPRRDLMLVSLAGPAANLILAVASAGALKLLILAGPLLPAFFLRPLLGMCLASVWINLLLAVFNCLPVPPLDGSKVLAGLLPPALAQAYSGLERFGFLILLILVATGTLSRIISPVIHLAQQLLLG
ncbi:MAG: site-2 protease family protein [Thermodesulfobacteriota bacterium]